MCLGQITLSKIEEICPFNSKPKQDLNNINVHTKFGENPLKFTCYHLEMKIQMNGCTTDRQKDGQTDRWMNNVKP